MTKASTAPARAGESAEATRPPSVLAVVVTHRGRRWLRQCLVGLNTQTYRPLDVLVVDDASPDFRRQPHLKRVAKRHLRRRRWGWVRTPRPLGFGGAINWALGRVRTDADLLLFVHDDAVLEPDAVRRMVERVSGDDRTAIVGPKIVAWDDASRLEEVGMAVDRFGYPYKGLEQGEIDLGQHDTATEVFYVTSTCLMIRHQVFSALGGWDAGMRAFSEDLDLCWRARLAGHGVRVEPEARARHAIALARGERESPFQPARYFIRRNRLRTVTKNVSPMRLLGLAPQLVLVALAEMLAFLLLRQPREMVNVLRAILWNVAALPRTLADRSRVQRTRAVRDERLRRLMVRESTRVRAYVEHQAARMEEAWGKRTEYVASRSRRARQATSSFTGLGGAALVAGLLLLVLGFRNFHWAPPIAVGDILPFPGRAFSLWGAYLSPWQLAGLGRPGPAPPAFGILGWFSILSFGDAGAAQKLLLVVSGLAGFAGAYRLVAASVDRPSRAVAGFVYLLGGVGYSGMRHGHLGALIVGACAPYVIHSFLGLTGWQRPAGFSRSKAIAQAALATAVGGAFVPGSLALFGACAVVLALAWLVVDRPLRPLSGLGWSILSLAAGGGLLLPWALTWLHPDGPFGRLMGDATRGVFTSAYSGSSMAGVVLGQTPDVPALAGLALPLVGLVAVLVTRDQRLHLSLAMWALVVCAGWFVGATASGLLPPLVASPLEAGIPASLAFAGLAGLAAAGVRLDLRSVRLGYRQPLALGAAAAALFLGGVGIIPALWAGHWSPAGEASTRSQVMSQAGALLPSQHGPGEHARVLWVGSSWSSDPPTGSQPVRDFLITGRRGERITDLFEHSDGPGQRRLASAISSIEAGGVDQGGSLIGAFNVGWVVLDRSPGAFRWLSQRDLTLVRTDPDYILLQNDSYLARAGLYTKIPPSLEAVSGGDAESIGAKQPILRKVATRRSPYEYRADGVTGPGVLFLAAQHDPAWTASVGDEVLPRIPSTWGNAFEVPASAGGQLEIVFPRPPSQVAWLVAVAIAWLIVIGASFGRGSEPGDLR
jgi:GT2 family glycosyltransferase